MPESKLCDSRKLPVSRPKRQSQSVSLSLGVLSLMCCNVFLVATLPELRSTPVHNCCEGDTDAPYECCRDTSAGSYACILEHGWEPRSTKLAGLPSIKRSIPQIHACNKGVMGLEAYQNGPMNPQIWRTNVTKTPILADSLGWQSTA